MLAGTVVVGGPVASLAGAEGDTTETHTGPWPFSSWDAFVAQQQLDLTGSAGTAASRAASTQALASGSKLPSAVIQELLDGPWFGGQVAPVGRLYWAYFGRIPDYSGLTYWVRKRRAGTNLTTISQRFASSSEFTRTYGTLSNRAFVELVYNNVLGRPGDAAGIASWTKKLDAKSKSRGQVMVGFSESSEYIRKKGSDIAVLTLVVGLLGRSPSAAELTAPQVLTVPQMIDSVRRSTEYGGRLGLPGTGEPDAPTSLVATAGASGGAARLEWQVGDDRGAPILGFVVTPYVGSTARAAYQVPGNRGGTTITGLTIGTTYTFRVAARSVRGTGANSALSNAVVPGQGSATSIDFSERHGCAATNSAGVRCWGTYGKATDTRTDYHIKTTIEVAGTSGALSTQSGIERSCALLPGSTASCWYYNESGGTVVDGKLNPLQTYPGVRALSLGGAVATASPPTDLLCLVAVAGTVSCRRSTGALTAVVGVSDAAAIDVGLIHQCVVTTGHLVKCWGSNASGQLGDGTTSPRTSPVTVSGVAGATAVAAGDAHTCAIVTGGKVRCWGSNQYGQTGKGTTGSNDVTSVEVLNVSHAVQLAAGASHTCARLDNGTVRCWGRNRGGQIGDGTINVRPVATTVAGLSGARNIAASGDATCATTSTGAPTCWGDQASASQPPTAATQEAKRAQTTDLRNTSSVVEGEGHACRVVTLGVVECWGSNSRGQLGTGGLIDLTAPAPVPGQSGVISITAGRYFTCAVRADGSVSCWGANDVGQLGDGTLTDRRLPTTVVGVSGATRVEAGQRHACAIVAGGAVKCWGFNAGQLGDGTATNRSTAVTVAGLSGVKDLALGDLHTCALLAAGTVRCWGQNNNGELGDGTTVDHFTPAATVNTAGATAIAAGYRHTCAIVAGGASKCWGLDGLVHSGPNLRLPVPVPGLSGASALAAGGNHTCALVSASVRCWGENNYGELGDGTAPTGQTAPTSMLGAARVGAIGRPWWGTFVVLESGAVRYAGELGWRGVAADIRITPVQAFWY
jgi:alpha-tubulin suppressor-like RCC1 family protein